uniref:Uncharacterized protein n=1 Tax=Onchocerca volvulus TaxID=6282 RepID=A0A8R1TT31_ONCVO
MGKIAIGVGFRYSTVLYIDDYVREPVWYSSPDRIRCMAYHTYCVLVAFIVHGLSNECISVVKYYQIRISYSENLKSKEWKRSEGNEEPREALLLRAYLSKATTRWHNKR